LFVPTNEYIQSAIPSRPSSKLAHTVSQLLSGSGSSISGSSSEGGDAVQHHVDAAAVALLDVAQMCVYRITNAYGAVLGSVVGQVPPLVGSKGDAVALLNSFLAYEQ
jgi:hypothetical protein